MTPPFPNKKSRPDWVLNVLIPVAYLFLTLGIDYSMPYSTITPLMGISGLMVFAFCLHPRWMIFWSIIYTVVVASIFLNPEIMAALNGNAKLSPDPVTPWLRTGSFALGATLSSILCVTMGKLVSAEKSLKELIEKIPTPIITSDINGDIVIANQTAEMMMKAVEHEVSRNYFDIFPIEGHQGTLIASYLERFHEGQNAKPLHLDLGGVRYLGRTHLLKQSTPHVLMTILEKDEHSPALAKDSFQS